jgi:F-type H+-transporting ATPase subunit gamma
VPSLKTIRKRIGTVRSTQKITRAMKLVAAARLRRAQDAILQLRPYARRLHEVVSELAARQVPGEPSHALLARREMKRVELVILTSDRGLCGGFNSTIVRAADRFVRENRERFEVILRVVVGRKGRDYYRHRRQPMAHEFPGVSSAVGLERASHLASMVIDDFLLDEDKRLDGVFLVYNEFKSAGSQRVTVEQLLPIEPIDLGVGHAADFIYEPSRPQLLDHLVPLHVQTQVYRAVLESVASELGARMTAMENATNNATDLIRDLSLVYNRARQASITKELMEIIGGAEAMRG